MHPKDQEALVVLAGVILVIVALMRRRWRPSTSAFGTARWASEKVMRAAGMFGQRGLILGRTLRGQLIRLPNYCHVLLVGATGSGKGVSIIIPNLLDYFRGSVVCFDTKGDLYRTCRNRRSSRGKRVIRLAPFGNTKDSFNPLDTIRKDSPKLVDEARAMSEALVVRLGTEHDPHWNDKAVQVITAILVLVLMRFEGEDRSLNSVQEIASDPKMLFAAADKLREMGGIPARLGNQLKALFE